MNDEFYGLPPREEQDSGPPVGTIAMIAGLVLAALGFVVVGVGFALGWFDGDAGDDEVAQVEVDEGGDGGGETGPPADVPMLHGAEVMPVAEDRPQPKAVEEVDALAGAEPVPEIPPPGSAGGQDGGDGGSAGGSGGSGGSGGAKWSGPRVSVSFDMGHYEHVEIKLGGRVITLDKNRTIKLRPGGYRVELRKSADAPWKSAGLLDVEVGSRYRVTLFDPPLAKLEVIE
jgi:hypothetical protein